MAYNAFWDCINIEADDGSIERITLRPRSVADFYQELMGSLSSLGMPITIWTTPVEVPDRTPFENDHKHATYNPEHAQRLVLIIQLVTVHHSLIQNQFIRGAI